MRIFPAIDIMDGKAVRLKLGEADSRKIYGDPVEFAKKWQDEGADALHIVDLDAAFSGEFKNKDTISAIVKNIKIPVQLGGGVRTRADVQQRLEDVCVSRVILGTAAIENMDMLIWACEQYPDRIIVGIDAKNGIVQTRGWVNSTEILAVDLAKKVREVGVDTIVYTDIARDGMLAGPNTERTGEMVKCTWLNIIASGGVSTVEDIVAVRGTGACGAIIGTALYEGRITVAQALKAAK